MPSNIFIPKIFLVTGLNRGNKNWGESGENAFMYIKGRFKPIIPLYVTSFLRKLKFLIRMPPPQCCYPNYACACHSVTSSDVFTVVIDQMMVLFWVSGRRSGSITAGRRNAQPSHQWSSLVLWLRANALRTIPILFSIVL